MVNLNTQRKPAFTLVELLVVISVFTVLIAVSVSGYRTGSRQSQLSLAAQELASNIKLAQSYALGSKDFDEGQVLPTGGWGVYLSINDLTSYQIVVDLDNDHSWNKEKDGLFRKINLPEKIIIKDILYNNETIDSLAVFFRPPDPQVFLNGKSSGQTIIKLEDRVTQETISVAVNFFGLVEVENND